MLDQDLEIAFGVVDDLFAKGCRLILSDWRDLSESPSCEGWMALFELPGGHDTGQFIGRTPSEAIRLAAKKANEFLERR